MFNIGDVVRVKNWGKWSSEPCEVVSYDWPWYMVKHPAIAAPGGFREESLALVDDSASHIPEDWS